MFEKYHNEDGQPGLGLPTIQINKRNLRDVANDIGEAIIASNNPPTLFVRDGRICKIALLRNGTSTIKPLTVDSICNIASKVANYVRADRNDETEPAFLTAQICRDILFGGEPSVKFPRLTGVT